MTEGLSFRQQAAGLMRVALPMLDEAGEATAAAHLQTALDILAEANPAEPDDEVMRTAAVAAHPAIVRAIGGALVVLSSLMERQGTVSAEEFSRILGTYAVVTDETARDEGLILGYWAGILRDFAQSLSDRRTDQSMQGRE